MLEISHLVVNGDSFTYCQGLENPMEVGWPALLAKKLNVPVVNLALCGCNNNSIVRRTYEYFYMDKNTKPFYIIGFSHATREEDIIQSFLKLNHYTFELRKLIYWLNCVNLFKSNNIPYVVSDFLPSWHNIREGSLEKYTDLHNQVYNDPNKLKNFNEITREYPRVSKKDAHDGYEAQYVLADYCYAEIIKRYGDIKPINLPYTTLKEYHKFYNDENPYEDHNWIENV